MRKYRSLNYFSNQPPEKVQKARIAASKGDPKAIEAHREMSSHGGEKTQRLRAEEKRVEKEKKLGSSQVPLDALRQKFQLPDAD